MLTKSHSEDGQAVSEVAGDAAKTHRRRDLQGYEKVDVCNNIYNGGASTII